MSLNSLESEGLRPLHFLPWPGRPTGCSVPAGRGAKRARLPESVISRETASISEDV